MKMLTKWCAANEHITHDPLAGYQVLPMAQAAPKTRKWGLSEIPIGTDEGKDVVFAQRAALIAERAAHRLPMGAAIQKLYPAPAGGVLAIGDDPDIGFNAYVVEHLLRQREDRFQPIVLDDPLADTAFAGPGPAAEQGGAAEDARQARAIQED